MRMSGKGVSICFGTFSLAFVATILHTTIAAVSLDMEPTEDYPSVEYEDATFVFVTTTTPRIQTTRSPNTIFTTKKTFEPQLSHNRELCVSECSRKGESYYWCYISKERQTSFYKYYDTCTPNRGHIRSLQNQAVDGIISLHGLPCESECSPQRHSCGTQEWKPCIRSRPRSWDYCSPGPAFVRGKEVGILQQYQ